ncbi:tRNA (N6-threonylcarbamoyladenosine(37)-N6)-methyltransferase TrmO [Paenibacillus donghaensis]|uniref:tRNA (N6-threonylcarbamoyladenosine(37)-N6)-methyltransferase TrmO n=1 Tax=Paenibacillus donghaensis TaxID=414771 RepID=A0A2Z2KFP4_9BACL|nr:tRNA (N6-threonylcarbamoyladenosine(37)-N6)-methyltransferase TrmO [Paenibacillus donghaensis]ASA25576.1 tRNA (N6-threonylcarbamoyladenosine(37)-N6)-methyltransferase TrmO [Paenibacillus donghaensis]
MSKQGSYTIVQIGVVQAEGDHQLIQLQPEFGPALKGLSEFSHCQVIWWLSEFAEDHFRQTTQIQPPYDAPLSGVFSTRSPVRPNPLGLSVATILSMDEQAGVIELSGLDAYPGTPVLDIKAYFPSTDRVKDVTVPVWAASWGDWVAQ